MSIAKLPKRNISSLEEDKEQKAKSFIEKAGITSEESYSLKNLKTPIMIRFDTVLLKKVEVVAKKRGINRSALIQFLVSRSIDENNI